MAAKKSGNSTEKAGSERFITSASGIVVTKKGGQKQPAKHSGGKAKGGK